MKNKIFLLLLLLIPACVSNLGKIPDVKPTPVASKSAASSKPIFTPPVVSTIPSKYETPTPSSTPFFVEPENTCLKFYTSPTPLPALSGSPDIAGDFAPHYLPIKGTIYDKNKNIVPNATVKMEVVSNFYRDMCVFAETKTDSNGNYIFKDIIDNITVKIVVSKLEYKDVSRIENVENHRKDIFSIIDFGGSNPQDANYFLEKL